MTSAREGRPRFHHLDWLRVLMVCFVVVAHIACSSPNGVDMGRGVVIDNRDFKEDKDANTLAVRYISIIRPWCLPLLFFVSGAACACSYKKDSGNSGSLITLAIVTVVGMASNACLWYLGPQDDSCSITAYARKSKCKGVLFDFTFVPGLGNIFPIVFQMWYTAVLMIFIVLNRPLFAIVDERRISFLPLAKYLLSWIGFYGLLLWCGGDSCETPLLAGTVLTVFELCFAWLASLLLTAETSRPSWCPLRAVHYALALCMVLQYSLTPIFAKAFGSSGLSIPWILATFPLAFNKFFQLGFLVTHPRRSLNGSEDAEPLMSEYWPVMIFFLAMCSQSTNFSLSGGNLTYPYLHRPADRAAYVSYAAMVMFIFDRVSRWKQCQPLPSLLNYASLVLYIFHPVVCTVLLAFGLESIFALCTLSIGIVFLLVCIGTNCLPGASSGKRDYQPSDSGTSTEPQLTSELQTFDSDSFQSVPPAR